MARFLDVLGPGDLYVGVPSSDAITNHLAGTGATVRNDVKVCRLYRNSHHALISMDALCLCTLVGC